MVIVYFIFLIADDEAAEKILHTDNLPKHLLTYNFLLPIIGKTSLVTVKGDYWRKVRKMFSPAFATSHLETLVPGIVEEAMVFLDLLSENAEKDKVLRLGERLPALTMDVIGRYFVLLCVDTGFFLVFDCKPKRMVMTWQSR